MEPIIKNIISDMIGKSENLIFSNIVGQTIYFFGSQCHKWDCHEWNERCDIGCEKLKTPEIRNIIVTEMLFRQVKTIQNEIKQYVLIGNGETKFNVNDLNTDFFTSESDAKAYLDSHELKDIHIHHVDD